MLESLQRAEQRCGVLIQQLDVIISNYISAVSELPPARTQQSVQSQNCTELVPDKSSESEQKESEDVAQKFEELDLVEDVLERARRTRMKYSGQLSENQQKSGSGSMKKVVSTPAVPSSVPNKTKKPGAVLTSKKSGMKPLAAAVYSRSLGSILAAKLRKKPKWKNQDLTEASQSGSSERTELPKELLEHASSCRDNAAKSLLKPELQKVQLHRLTFLSSIENTFYKKDSENCTVADRKVPVSTNWSIWSHIPLHPVAVDVIDTRIQLLELQWIRMQIDLREFVLQNYIDMLDQMIDDSSSWVQCFRLLCAIFTEELPTLLKPM